MAPSLVEREESSGIRYQYRFQVILTQRHSDEHSEEDSGAGLARAGVHTTTQTRRFARGDLLLDLLRQSQSREEG